MEQVALDIAELAAEPAAEEDGGAESDFLDDDETICYISNQRVKLKGNEPVRQHIAHVLFFEYGIAFKDMERNFPVRVEIEGRRKTKRADIAIFEAGAPHTMENLRRVVICKPEPPASRTVTKIRTYDQARTEIAELQELLGTEATPLVQYGLWTNGLDFFYLYKESTRLGAKFEPRADWPINPQSEPSSRPGSLARLRRGEAAQLSVAFRRCHNFIHGNEGMPKDAAFWQFLYLLYAKMHDEKCVRKEGRNPQFYALPAEPFTEDGRRAIQQRILALFAEVKKQYPLFGTRDEITLSPRALAFIVGELWAYDFTGTAIDAKGLAYQELVGSNLRGDRGQYFTPSGAVELMVRILAPKEKEKVLDPACGTGGFLREVLRYRLDKWREAEGAAGRRDTAEQVISQQERLAEYAEEHLFGADFDPFLVRATSMSIMTLTGGAGNIYHMDSLAFPHAGNLRGVEAAKKTIMPGHVDVLMTNPPFGTDIKIEDPLVLDHYRQGVAKLWSRGENGAVNESVNPASAMAPEQLFVQKAVEWVHPGGRIGIVLPNGILSNPGATDEAIRRWILEHCWVLASIELPVETFIVGANVNILTTLLFLKRKTENEHMASLMAGGETGYPVFMAVAEKVGFDRRGNPVYKRGPDGKVELEEYDEPLTFAREAPDGKPLRRRRKKIDNDLPGIAEAYERFRARYPEPPHFARPA